MKTFENLFIWKKAQDLAVEIYADAALLPDRNLNWQLTSAAVSISSNIAEGFHRKGIPEFKHFLFIALASNAEVKSLLHILLRLKFLSKERFDQHYATSSIISAGIIRMIKVLDSK